MFHPTRGGTRGGRDQFSWENVKTDKDRECYLGHSLMAPVGRWQQGKDIQWYAHDKEAKKAQINEEFNKAKEAEERALMAALGYKVVPKREENQYHAKEQHNEQRVERSKSSKESQNSKSLKSQEKEYLDKMLMKFLNKYGIQKVVEALGGEKKSKKKKKKKDSSKRHKSSKKSSSNRKSSDENSQSSSSSSSSNSSSSDDDSDNEQSGGSNKKRKQKSTKSTNNDSKKGGKSSRHRSESSSDSC